jgi:hypothetical protein
MEGLDPICIFCSEKLYSKIGTKIVTCIACNAEFHLLAINSTIPKKPKKKNQTPTGLDEFFWNDKPNQKLKTKGNWYSGKNLEDWK